MLFRLAVKASVRKNILRVDCHVSVIESVGGELFSVVDRRHVVAGDSLYLVYIDHAVTGNADGVDLFTVESVLGEELVEGVSVARL